MNTWRNLMGTAQLIMPNLIATLLTFCELSGPRVSSITPNIGNQGMDVPVHIDGANFVVGIPGEYPRIVIDGSRNEGVTTDFNGSTDPYYDTFIDLTLHIDPTARLGVHTIAIETLGGADAQTFYVTCPGCPPLPHLLNLITQPENTRLVAGGPPVTFRFVGTNFLNTNPEVHIGGTGVTPDPGPPVVQQTGCPASCLDYFDVPITAAAGTGGSLYNVAVTTDGGPSNILRLTVDDPVPVPSPSPGSSPTLTRITPTHVCKCGEHVNIKLEGSGFGTLPSLIVDNPSIQGIGSYSTYQADPDQVLVATVLIPDNIPDTSVQVRIQNQDNQTISQPLILFLDERNPERPLAGVRYGGSIYQGGNSHMIIAGDNLPDPPAVIFSGIAGLSFSNVHWGILGLEVDVLSDASLTPVTGDQATNLTITTDKGQSNLFRFRILRPQ
jgi:hypothetical protein